MLLPLETQRGHTLDDVTDDVIDYLIDFDVSDDVVYSQIYCSRFAIVLRNVLHHPQSITVIIRLLHVKSIIGYRHIMGSPVHACFNVIVLIYLRNDDQVSVYYITMDLPEHGWT